MMMMMMMMKYNCKYNDKYNDKRQVQVQLQLQLQLLQVQVLQVQLQLQVQVCSFNNIRSLYIYNAFVRRHLLFTVTPETVDLHVQNCFIFSRNSRISIDKFTKWIFTSTV